MYPSFIPIEINPFKVLLDDMKSLIMKHGIFPIFMQLAISFNSTRYPQYRTLSIHVRWWVELSLALRLLGAWLRRIGGTKADFKDGTKNYQTV
jgi:hypothetical protein